LKRKPAKTKGLTGTRASKAERKPAAQRVAVTSPRRRLAFRLVALVSPVLLLCLVELGLRLAGAGYPVSFFLSVRQEGGVRLVDNPRFGWRFFPPELARAPRPLSLNPHKPLGTIRIIVLGESAAMGDPEAAYGFARQLEQILQDRHPEKKIEVVNAAMTAINSHVIREIAKDCRQLAADYWLIYAGNNEVVGPFGAGTVFGRQAAGLTAVRLNLALKSTRVGQLAARLARKGSPPREWEGMEMFLDQQVSQDDPRLRQVYRNFAANIDDVVRLGQAAGAKVVISTMPVNLKDCPPFASAHRAELGPKLAIEWQSRFDEGKKAEAEGRYANALALFKEAGALDDQFAELAFRRGRCQLALGHPAEARAEFLRARDLDTLRFRADSRLNEIVCDVARARKITLIDAERELSHQAPQGLPGEDFFYDHVHLNFTGNYRVAVLFARAIEQTLGSGEKARPAPFLSEAEIERRLAFTPYDQQRVGRLMQLRLRQPPFSSQLNFQERDRRWEQTLAALPASPTNSVPGYRTALALAPDDWVLLSGFGQLLEDIPDRKAAQEQWSRVVQLMPHWPNGWFHLGSVAEATGNLPQAEQFLRHALELAPDSVEALTELALVRAARGAPDEALHGLETVLKIRPGFIPARLDLAAFRAQQNDINGAIEQYQDVLRRDTNNLNARLSLANLLASHGQPESAFAVFSEAIRLKPHNATAHLAFGKALAESALLDKAIVQLRRAVEIEPGLAEAHCQLGIALARANHPEEALKELEKAVRLKPDLVDARFNRGVTLAKAGRFSEAADDFRETLRLQPAHPLAKRFLDQALRSTGHTPAATLQQ